MTRAVKALLLANAGVFLLQWILGPRIERLLVDWFALTPAHVFGGLRLWQPVTYMFMHADLMHLLFNMLVLWMFGVTLERRWGREAFVRYYFVCGVGAALTSLVMSWLPFGFADQLYATPTVGASGAIYGLLIAFGILFPDATIYFFIFPIPARIYVFFAAALVLWSAVNEPVGSTAHFAHLGGMGAGYLYLTRGRGGPWAELKYRYVKWRMNRMRQRFGVHQGGRGWDERVH